MENGFEYQELKPLLVQIESYHGDGLVFVIPQFAEKWNHVPMREISVWLLEKSNLAPLQLSHPKLKG